MAKLIGKPMKIVLEKVNMAENALGVGFNLRETAP